MTSSSARAPLPTRTQRTRPVTNNGKAFPQYRPASVRSSVTSSDICSPISSSQSRTHGDKHTISSSDTTYSAPFPYNYDSCLWDDNTRLYAYLNLQCLSIFHLQTCRTNANRYGRRRSFERRTENIVWDSGLECQGGLQWAGTVGVSGGAGWRTPGIAESTTRNGMERAIETW